MTSNADHLILPAMILDDTNTQSYCLKFDYDKSALQRLNKQTILVKHLIQASCTFWTALPVLRADMFFDTEYMAFG